ncbi:peptidoglycan D,D-transpeptidase FtsI family protein [Rhizorhapis suberifaciens]|uniref:Cell division protein FtsI (Penicillin-binding protein 3) n=1 Tax=Rhizorhapis suberifaciens TaxID=13656 RepID=A0A840HPZ2_9SPHN|nr:penicillin-binding protein 2 [Rhizorhapis suberifaciens]MBB4639729.1 cell division protein FtsI (penicillin-binding protein 3) [Rhizorhapis suberifaciens]
MTTLVARPERVRTASQRYQLTEVAHHRLMLLLLLFAAAMMLLSLRLLWLGLFADGAHGARGPGSLVPARADIVDRNGVPLARTMDAYSIGVRPRELIADPMETARHLHDIFPDEPVASFYKKLTRDVRFTYLRRRALPEEVSAVNALGEIAIEFPREKERLYPQRTLGAHVLGFVDLDGQGAMGAERAFDGRLTDDKLKGSPFVLSIDSRVQGALESELYAGMTAHKAIGAAGLVLDANTGEVIAMASLPVFNPNKLAKGHMEARRNDVTQAVYELGSTFKPISIAAAMDAGVVTSMSKRYDATQPLQVGRFRIRDDHPLKSWINVPQTLVHSSNIATARIADELGAQRMQAALRKLEFDHRPSIELKERGDTLWPSNWGRLTNMTVSYGHGIAVTPLHLASAYAALVNGGLWRPATLQKLNDGEVPKGRRVFTAATSARMRQLLRMIVAAGTGRSADAKGFRVGGKTGSAEKPFQGGYARSSLVTTFAAAFPMENPKYVVLTMLDEPKGTAETFGLRTAAWTAAPIVKKVVERIGPMLGIFPDLKRDVDISELMPLLGEKEDEEAE